MTFLSLHAMCSRSRDLFYFHQINDLGKIMCGVSNGTGSNDLKALKVIYVKKLQFIHTVNGDGSKTLEIRKRHY